MILNAYAILDGFVGLLRLGLAIAVFLLAWTTWRRLRRATPAGRQFVEDRFHLLLLTAGLLLVLNIAAWPLFYLLLQSYVPEWPEVMCIYGVTRIGTGTVGTARHLPPLVTLLQLLKPLVVFLSGAWFVLHLVNRRTRTSPLTGRILVGMLAAGAASTADACAELAYLIIPKKEEFLSSGCCTTALDEAGPGRFLPSRLVGPTTADWLTVGFIASTGLLVVALMRASRAWRHWVPIRWIAALAALAAANLLVGSFFLTEVAAPRLLHMPDHHCPYDLVEQAPRAVVAVALFVVGTFAVGWSAVARGLGRSQESAAILPRVIGTQLRLAATAYLAAAALLTTELVLA